jgi:hypothetical protein
MFSRIMFVFTVYVCVPPFCFCLALVKNGMLGGACNVWATHTGVHAAEDELTDNSVTNVATFQGFLRFMTDMKSVETVVRDFALPEAKAAADKVTPITTKIQKILAEKEATKLQIDKLSATMPVDAPNSKVPPTTKQQANQETHRHQPQPSHLSMYTPDSEQTHILTHTHDLCNIWYTGCTTWEGARS